MNGEVLAQPLLAHLTELRRRLIWCFAVFVVATGLSYYFANDIYAFITEPLAVQSTATNRRLIYTSLTEAFTTYLRVALFMGGFITVPFIMAQVWLFMSPGLFPGERRNVLPFFIAAPVLFLIGACLCFYGVIPAAWAFFLSFEAPKPAYGMPIVLEARVGEYLSLTMTMVFAFGMAFQLPIVLGLLAQFGIIKAAHLKKFRKWAVVIILIVAAVLTPTPDIFGQIAMAVPLYLLYEISIALVSYLQRNKAGKPVTEPSRDLDVRP